MYGFYVKGSVNNITDILKQILEKIFDHYILIFNDYLKLVAFQTFKMLELNADIVILRTVVKDIYAVAVENFIGNEETLELSYNFLISDLKKNFKQDILNERLLFYF